MNNTEMISRIYEKLGDEKSKRTFEARLKLIINRDYDEFLEWFYSENKELYCPEIDQYEKESGVPCGYILFGAGREGKKACDILKACNKKIIAWCDNNKNLWGTTLEGIPVISPAMLINDYREQTVIITPRNGILEICQQLLMMEFPRDKIFIPKNGFLLGFCGRQYFDMFEAEKEEIFVDAGCWNGETTKQFKDWCNGNYHKIFAFEPDEFCWKQCENMFEKERIDNVVFIKKGTWKHSGMLYFKGNGIGGSRICEKEEALDKVQVGSIDDELRGEKVTFIKMDVEGSEMETLMGAKESILKYKPKLAVCVYHKNEDLWKLADYVLQLNPEYKIYLRHYTTCSYETVLYAV